MRRGIDDLAISLATGQSRRGTLKQLLLGAVGIPAVALGMSEAEAKKKNKNKKKNKKKITLCHSGQTIKVSKKAKKKHLKHGDTVGPCPETPACTPNANPCGNRECGTADNGCGVQVSCGECTAPEICNNNTGQCGCTPNNNPCAGRECGTKDDGCGNPVQCGTCTSPETCDEDTGQCDCTPNPNACDGRECGTVDNGCGQQVQCGTCTDPEICNTNTGQCVCTPDPTVCDGRECGTADDACGNTFQCGANSGACPAATECQEAGVCNANTGQCSYANKADDTPCGSNLCEETCQSGVCSNTPVVCPDNNLCQSSTCDPSTGICSAPTPIACPAPPECQTGAGVCDPLTGDCAYTNVADGTPCGADKCAQTCQGGQCENIPVVCPVDNLCQASTCDPASGACSTPTPITCPDPPECNSAGICDNDTGECVYTIAPGDIGGPCGTDDTGICVKNDDLSGSCVLTNNGTTTCIGADPCGEVNPPRQCAESNPWGVGDCGCYSTVEEGGLCLRRIGQGLPNAFTYPYSAVGCFSDVRPGCNVSADCDAGWVCAPLDELGTSTGTCCAGYDGFRGACVQVATDICTAPPA